MCIAHYSVCQCHSQQQAYSPPALVSTPRTRLTQPATARWCEWTRALEQPITDQNSRDNQSQRWATKVRAWLFADRRAASALWTIADGSKLLLSMVLVLQATTETTLSPDPLSPPVCAREYLLSSVCARHCARFDPVSRGCGCVHQY